MNVYVIGGLIVAACLGEWRLCSFIYDQGASDCEARHQKADNAVLHGALGQAGQDAKNTDTVTAEHQQTQRDNGEQHEKVIERIRVIHDKAAPSDCLRQPVAPELDQQLRDGAASADRPPGDHAAEHVHGS